MRWRAFLLADKRHRLCRINTGPDNLASALVRRISELKGASFPRWIPSQCCVVQGWSMTVEYSLFLKSNTCLLAGSLWHLYTSHLSGAESLSRMKVIYCDTTGKCHNRITWRTLIRKELKCSKRITPSHRNRGNHSIYFLFLFSFIFYFCYLFIYFVLLLLLFCKPQCETNLVGLTTYKRLHTRVSIGRFQFQWTEIHQNPLILYPCIKYCLPRRQFVIMPYKFSTKDF
jgi:hypothetical protein